MAYYPDHLTPYAWRAHVRSPRVLMRRAVRWSIVVGVVMAAVGAGMALLVVAVADGRVF